MMQKGGYDAGKTKLVESSFGGGAGFKYCGAQQYLQSE
jgi:hypothetical protein